MSGVRVNLVVLLLAQGEDPAKILSIESALPYLVRRRMEIHLDGEVCGKSCAAICIQATGFRCTKHGIHVRMGRNETLTIPHEELHVSYIADNSYGLKPNDYMLVA